MTTHFSLRLVLAPATRPDFRWGVADRAGCVLIVPEQPLPDLLTDRLPSLFREMAALRNRSDTQASDQRVLRTTLSSGLIFVLDMFTMRR